MALAAPTTMSLKQDLKSLAEGATGLLDQITWKGLLLFSSGGLLCKLLWKQYGILCCRNRPYTALGWPIYGYTAWVNRHTMERMPDSFVTPRPAALLTNICYTNVAMIDYSVYMEKLHQRHVDGDFKPEFTPSFRGCLGEESIMCQPGGKVHTHHKKLRNKLLSSLAPKPCLSVVPELTAEIRATLDHLVEESAKNGSVAFQPVGGHLAAKISQLQILSALEPELQKEVEHHTQVMILGLFEPVVDLGRFNNYGRAMASKKALQEIVKTMLKNPVTDKRNVLADLAKSNEDGEAFTEEESLDTIVTLLVAGKLTTGDALPNLFVHLCEHREWVEKIAQEPLDFKSIECESATLKFVMESLRADPVVTTYRRSCAEPVDLGEHGVIPANCQMAIQFRSELLEMDDKFDPLRWTPEQILGVGWLPFGGHQPHSCVGRNLALLELQLFARILCREYNFEALETEKAVHPQKNFSPVWKDGLPVKVTKKSTEHSLSRLGGA
mmetsp:Transcript_85865/g.179432  ORF Transcript_85865/g.179432 Transcript_85865/m.179432 type:complete len:497 (-) Transcript_85865:92-1582(-)